MLCLIIIMHSGPCCTFRAIDLALGRRGPASCRKERSRIARAREEAYALRISHAFNPYSSPRVLPSTKCRWVHKKV